MRNCPPAEDVLRDEARDEHLKLFPRTAHVERVIKGRRVAGTPDELDLLSKTLGEKAPKAWHSDSFRCSIVLDCLAQLLKNREAAYRLLNIARRTGYVPMLDQSKNPKEQVWKVKELRLMDWAFQSVPSQFYRLPTLHQIYRKTDGYRENIGKDWKTAAAYARSATSYSQLVFRPENLLKLKSPNELEKRVSSPGIIMIYDSMFDKMATNEFSASSFIHELGHHVDFSHQVSGSAEFRQAADREKAVSTYGDTNYLEAFAELFAEFIVNPEMVAVKNPQQYAFIKNFVETKGPAAKLRHPFAIEWPRLERSLTRDFVKNVLLTKQAGIDSVYYQRFHKNFHNPNNPLQGTLSFSVRKEGTYLMESAELCRALGRLPTTSEENLAVRQQLSYRLLEPYTFFRTLVGEASRDCKGTNCPSDAELKNTYDSNPAYAKLDKYFGNFQGLAQEFRNSPFAFQIRCEKNWQEYVVRNGEWKEHESRSSFLTDPKSLFGSIERVRRLACDSDLTTACLRNAYFHMLLSESDARFQALVVEDLKRGCTTVALSVLRMRKLTPALVADLHRMSLDPQTSDFRASQLRFLLDETRKTKK